MEDPKLKVVSIFDTIQGEGPFHGTPSTFIRLQDCNLNCPSCDTFYKSGTEMSVSEILDSISKMPDRGLVVITGGEPFMQDFSWLVCALQDKGKSVQVETNGMLWPGEEFFSRVEVSRFVVVCSPKTPNVDERLWRFIQAVKYIVEEGNIDPEDGLPVMSLGCKVRPARPPVGWKGVIYVQPFDSGDPLKNRRNAQAAVATCLRHGYRLSLQVHKMLGLP